MIENPEVATEVLQKIYRIHDQLEDVVAAAEGLVSAEELQALKRSIGHVLYESFDRIVEPICKKHPALRPPEMEN